MEKTEKQRKESEARIEKGERDYPGMAVNIADKGDKDTTCLQKERTKVLNNNPRNDSTKQ